MRALAFAWRYLWSRPLGTTLNIVLLSLGLSSMAFLLLVAHQLNQAFERDLAGIDAVVGAKGSPMQLILSGVFHIDVPPGNVRLKAVRDLERNPLIAQVIPLSLGDNLQGFRIVGTTAAYATHYGASLAQGRMWDAPMQVVVGAQAAKKLGLSVGSSFSGSHGLGAGGHAHGDQRYTVVGILAPGGNVLDRLLLTDLASVWQVHEPPAAPAAHDHGDEAEGADHDHAAEHEAAESQSDSDAAREVTMALVQYKTPLAAMSFPRWVNTTTDMQAASPAVEISRLLKMLGLGTDVLRAFAGVLLLTAALSVFIALLSAVRERRGDLALLRMLGAPPARIAGLLLLEAAWLGLLAAVAGLALGQCFAYALAWGLQLDNSLLIGGTVWPGVLWVVPGLALLVSVGAALLPAWGAYRVSVLELLQSR